MGTISTRGRLCAVRDWLKSELCAGREMKSPGRTLTDIIYREPEVYIGYYPTMRQRLDPRVKPLENLQTDDAAAPSILVMLASSYMRNMEEKRFDRYAGINRTPEWGGQLVLNFMYNVYECGTRYPGFDGNDINLIQDGTEDGIFTLTDWMDETMHKFDGTDAIPGSDLYLMHETVRYSQFIDGNYIADRRPFYYGIITATFGYYAVEKSTRANSERVEDALEPQ